MSALHNTGPRPVCPCRRSAASPIDQADAGQASAGQDPERRPARRTRGAAAFALPSIALALIPKCPMCIAAYLALGGGLGVSLSTAVHLRTALVWLCWGVLALLAARVAMRFTRGSGAVAIPRIRRQLSVHLRFHFPDRFAYSIAQCGAGVYKQTHRQHDLERFVVRSCF